jgi:hypothetical protein
VFSIVQSGNSSGRISDHTRSQSWVFWFQLSLLIIPYHLTTICRMFMPFIPMQFHLAGKGSKIVQILTANRVGLGVICHPSMTLSFLQRLLLVLCSHRCSFASCLWQSLSRFRLNSDSGSRQQFLAQLIRAHVCLAQHSWRLVFFLSVGPELVHLILYACGAHCMHGELWWQLYSELKHAWANILPEKWHFLWTCKVTAYFRIIFV